MTLRFSYPDYMQRPGVVIKPDSETGDMPGASVAVTRSDEFWRTLISPGASDAGMSVDLGQNCDIDFFGFQFDRQNLSTDVDEVNLAPYRLRIRVGTAEGADDVLDTNWQALASNPGCATFFKWLDTTITGRYLRFDIDASNLVGNKCVDIYRIYVGPQFCPEINMDWNPNLTWVDGNSSFSRGSRSTTRFFNENEKYRSLSFQLSWIKDETERQWWKDFERRVSTTREFAVSDTLEASGTGDLFAFQSSLSGINSTRVSISSKTVRFEENI